MFDRISRSWSLAGQCWDVLKDDPALLVFPLLSSIALLVLLGSFALPVFALYHSLQPVMMEGNTTHTRRLLFYLTMYGFYIVSYAVMMFFNSALISVALKRLDGESASVGDGLRMALANLPAILAYAVIAATVGAILRAIEERVGFVGRIVVAIIGLAFFLVCAAESTHVFGSIVLAMAFFVLALIAVGLVNTTLHAIYTAALYRFATGSKNNAGIDGDLLAAAYWPK